MNFSLAYIGNIAVLVFSLGFYANLMKSVDMSLEAIKSQTLWQRQVILCAQKDAIKHNIQAASIFLQQAYPERSETIADKEVSLLVNLQGCLHEQNFYEILKPKKSPFAHFWPNFKIHYLDRK